MWKLKLQVQMTIDGYIAGPNGEMDFMVWNWDEGLKNYIKELTDPVDTIDLGRKLAEGFIPYWANVAADPAHPEYSAGIKFTGTPKVVSSNTLDRSAWDRTVVAKGGLAAEISALKECESRDIIAYGGAGFVSSLIKEGLIDDFHLLINPTAIGTGMSIFGELDHNQYLALVKALSFDCGIVVLHYRPKGN